MKEGAKVFSVEVFTSITERDRITRWLVFDTYTTAANCIFCLTGREAGYYSPQTFFEAAKIYDKKKGEVLGDPIETEWVMHYIFKTEERFL